MEFKKNAEINTSDFWYDLFEGGYINPEKLLENKEDANKIKEAIALLKNFKDSAEEEDILNYL